MVYITPLLPSQELQPSLLTAQSTRYVHWFWNDFGCGTFFSCANRMIVPLPSSFNLSLQLQLLPSPPPGDGGSGRPPARAALHLCAPPLPTLLPASHGQEHLPLHHARWAGQHLPRQQLHCQGIKPCLWIFYYALPGNMSTYMYSILLSWNTVT